MYEDILRKCVLSDSTSIIATEWNRFCIHSVGSDSPQGFHQSLYSCLCALQDEEWELFQCTVDNTK